MKKYQSKSIHVGNIGEHLIASKLSQHCVVRNVSQGKDTGIDLYCEILKIGSLELSLHFFVQVKTSKKHISHSEIEKNLSYWSNQPVPVFLFLVKYSDLGSINSSLEIWVYDLPYFLAINDAKVQGYNGLKRDVNKRFLICNENNNKDKMTLETFLYHHIPFSYGLWQMRRFGLVLPNPEIKENMPEIFVGGLTNIYKEKIKKSISYAISMMKKVNGVKP
jgi:uncharacterized protein DUF4365